MLDKARSLYETLKANWIVGANKDQFQLALYLSVQNEFDSGNAKDGLLAKISAESNYDEKLTKANYVKARVSELMSKREKIASLMDSIQRNQDEIENFKNEVIESVTDSDRATVERFIQEKISAANKEVHHRIASKEIRRDVGVFISTVLGLSTIPAFQLNFILASFFAAGLVCSIIFSIYSFIGLKDLKDKEHKTTLEVRNSFSEQDKISKAVEIAKKRVERHKHLLQEKLSELTAEQARLHQELQKFIN